MSQPTHFAEANALLAVQEDDEETAEAILTDMSAAELQRLMRASQRLTRLASDQFVERRLAAAAGQRARAELTAQWPRCHTPNR